MKLPHLFLITALATLGTSGIATAGDTGSKKSHAHTHKVKAQQINRIKFQSAIGPHNDGLLLRSRQVHKAKQEPALGADFSKVRPFGGEDIGE